MHHGLKSSRDPLRGQSGTKTEPGGSAPRLSDYGRVLSFDPDTTAAWCSSRSNSLTWKRQAWWAVPAGCVACNRAQGKLLGPGGQSCPLRWKRTRAYGSAGVTAASTETARTSHGTGRRWGSVTLGGTTWKRTSMLNCKVW